MILIKNKYLILIIYSVFLIIFTTYVILDTLVIKEVYEVVDSNSTTDNIVNITSNNVVSKSDSYYEDDYIKITLKEDYQYNTKIFVADIYLKDINYLKTAFAKSSFGKNITDYTSNIANSNNAILAINGDYYGVRTSGYVIRNGILYRDTKKQNQTDLVIYKDGSFEIINESDISAKELIEKGALHVFSFGPSLVNNGEIEVSANTEVGQAMASNPRTAIGYIDKGHYLFVVSDGRTSSSSGLSLYQLANYMKSLGASISYNLDGGGSSTMVFNGKVINNPTTNGRTIKERGVSDIVYIG